MTVTGALYVYAIVPDMGQLEWGHIGIENELVTAVTEAGLAALVHNVPSGLPYAGSDDQVKAWALDHGRVVERAWEAAGTILPVTFDVLVKGDEGDSAHRRLQRWLREEHGALTEKLDRLRGRVELRVEIDLPRPDAAGSAASASGGAARLLEKRREMARRQQLDQRADALYQSIRRQMTVWADDIVELRRRRPATEIPVCALSLLVTRDRIEEVGLELARLQVEQPDAQIRFLGPWPPYSFSDARVSTLPKSAGAGDLEPTDHA